MKYFSAVVFVTLQVYTLASTSPVTSSQWPPEDASLDFKDLARKYGYKAHEYNLTTEDGYIVTLHRIPGEKTKPILLMHGLLDSSDTFILRGKKSLAAVLSDAGYDMWVGNCRGNKYSRRHTQLNPDTNNIFWNFSFHEMAVIDLRLFIDFILRQNNATKINLIGHSQGNSLFYALGSTIPEYNEKVGVAIALGPVAFINVENYRAPIDLGIKLGPILLDLLAMDKEEVFGVDSPIMQFRRDVCLQKGVGYTICADGIFSAVGGEDLEELEPEFFYSVIGHYPTSTSRKNLEHLIQMGVKKKFAQFDHGRKKNLKIYNSETPPKYDLKKVTMKVALLVGENDKLTPIKNVEMLRDKLPNVISYHMMERLKFNHVDHIWGKHMYKYLFPLIMKLLVRHG